MRSSGRQLVAGRLTLALVALLALAACGPGEPVAQPPSTRAAGAPTPAPTPPDQPTRETSMTPQAVDRAMAGSPAPSAPASSPTTAPPTPLSTPTAARSAAQAVLERMTPEQKVGQVFMLGFEGTTLTPDNRALVQGLHLGGVTLFARNVVDPVQVSALTRDLQSIADPVPLFISADQEGGTVVRITDGATIFPGSMALGATGDVGLARRVAEAQARELLAIGVNMNLAPVVDVNTNPRNPVIGVRAFGSDPAAVARFGAATVEGLQGAGVSAVAKHFPGHGDTSVDSHLDLPLVPHPTERLARTEWPPFQAAMRAQVDGIMAAHLALPAVEPRRDLPATLSRSVLTGLLRDRLGYTGLILTDALDMGAIKRSRSAAEAAVQSFEAGADMLLVAGILQEDRDRLAEAPRALLEAVRSGRIAGTRLDASVLRVLETKAKRGLLPGGGQAPPRPSLDVVGSSEHRALALDVARRAVTLVRDEARVLPIPAGARVLVVAPEMGGRTLAEDDTAAPGLAAAIRRAGGAARVEVVAVEPVPSAGSAVRAARLAQDADVVVLGTYDLARSTEQQSLARALASTGRPVVGVALRGPYDASAAPEIGTFLAVYGDRPVQLAAAAEALFGSLVPAGTLPVALP